MSIYETPEMDIMLYALGGSRPGTTGPGGDNSGDNTGGDDVIGTSGDVGGIGGTYSCDNIAPTNCSEGGNWMAGGCSVGDGRGAGNQCDRSATSAGNRG